MDRTRELALQPIGYVARGRQADDQGDSEETEAELEIDPTWAEALDGIEQFSHIWVIWWLDRYDQPPDQMRVRPERRPEMPLVGIFATRSPHRPNPIAMTPVRLLERRETRLRVRGLDAYEGTPILDLKPYLRRGDVIDEAMAAGWLERLWRIHDAETRSDVESQA
jgi:tRNA-Thr(GGU) m(6)t(6)A37 methyltransferase TsaA